MNIGKTKPYGAGKIQVSLTCGGIPDISYYWATIRIRVRAMMFNATFNNISVISWWAVLLVEESGVPGENHRPIAIHWQTLWHNGVSSTLAWALPFLLTIKSNQRILWKDHLNGDGQQFHQYQQQNKQPPLTSNH